MNFNSVNYMIFLPIVVLGYFIVPKKIKNIYLLAVNYYFYFCNEVRFFLLMPVLTATAYFCGRAIEKSQGKKKRPVFLASLLLNLGILVFFKYHKFFLGRITSFFDVKFNLSNWRLPAGISFYIFMISSYLIDIYLGKYSHRDNLVDFAVYISFFPHILMGPIDRANNFLPQLKEEHTFDYDRIKKGLQLMALGFFKKIAIADVLAMSINRVHSDLYSYSGFILIFTAFMYSFQLYADFSGYCDIARGSASLLGFKIRENFNTPYLATNFSQFWRRWHITLSSWFQDYIFTPFVWLNPLKKFGKIFEKPPVLIAVMLVFISSGIWHGNTWNFVIWGLLHGLYRVGEELIHRKFGKPKKKQKPLRFWLKVFGVFSLTTFSQIFFRCKDIPSALYYIGGMFNFNGDSFLTQLMQAVKTGFDATPILAYAYCVFCFVGLVILVGMDLYRYFKLKGKCLTNAFDKMNPVFRWVCYYRLVALIMAGFIMNNGGYGAAASFIYNNF